jgi:hypothetical protein
MAAVSRYLMNRPLIIIFISHRAIARRSLARPSIRIYLLLLAPPRFVHITDQAKQISIIASFLLLVLSLLASTGCFSVKEVLLRGT